MIQIGIVGGTGYTGVELLRILAHHPDTHIQIVTSRADAGTRVDVIYPSLRRLTNATFRTPNIDELSTCDVVFFATPNGTAMQMAPALLERGVKVIDLSADFRIQAIKIWEQWYNMTHTCPELVKQAVYGLPEINRAAIRSAQLVACPGCYPTTVQLGFLPLLERNLVNCRLVADVKSGTSGAGRKAELNMLMSETGESFKAYSASGHRHWPEIHQGLTDMAGREVELIFVPHLTPMVRGIHATLYAELLSDDHDLQALYEQHYQNEPFVDILPFASHPDTRNVRGSNHCQIALHRPPNSNTIVVLVVIDNLVKGASGQAVQNMNLMFDLPETLGLETVALYP